MKGLSRGWHGHEEGRSMALSHDELQATAKGRCEETGCNLTG
jgi:hypothetical protein